MKTKSTNQTEIFAHRGYRVVAPENTLPAFEAALAYPVDGLEIDLHRTKDGELVVIHDETVDRTTNGSGFIRDMTLAELKQLDAGSYKEPKMPGVQIPTFVEFMTFLETKKFTGKLLVEVKTDHIDYPGIEAQVLGIVNEFAPTYPVIYQSFNLETLRRFRKLGPDLTLAALVYWPSPKVYWRSWRGDFDYIHPDIRVLSGKKRLFWRVKNHLRPWTVDKERFLKWVFHRHYPGVITNEVARAIKLRDQIQGGHK
jgi:glycerophosphoryl diester phosphodiesterase